MNFWQFANDNPWLAFFLCLLAALSIETITVNIAKTILFLRKNNAKGIDHVSPGTEIERTDSDRQ